MEKKTALERANEYYEQFVKGNESEENVTHKKFYEDDGDHYITVGSNGFFGFGSDTMEKELAKNMLGKIYEMLTKKTNKGE